MGEKNNNAIYDMIWKLAIFKTCVDLRVDFFELLRTNDVEEYNRENTLYPLSAIFYKQVKEICKEMSTWGK